MVSRHPREVHLTDKFLYLLIQYKSPKVWNQVNNAIGVYLEPRKKHFTLTAPQAKSPQITEQTHWVIQGLEDSYSQIPSRQTANREA